MRDQLPARHERAGATRCACQLGRTPQRAAGLLRWAAIAILLLLVPAAGVAARANHGQAREEFRKAEILRQRLQSQPEESRRLADYLSAVKHYEQALHYGPTVSTADDSVMAAARLYAEMGQLFGESRYAALASERYRFLLKEYPHSRYVAEARRALAASEKAAAEKDRADRRQAERAAAAGAQMVNAAVEVKPGSGVARVTSIRHWSTPNYTRVVIELDSPVEYQAGRISNPDRIFFDLHNALLSSSLRHQSIPGNDELLKRIRVAQNQVGITRVVLEVGQVRDYSAFLLPNPYRLVVDINGGAAPARPTEVAAAAPAGREPGSEREVTERAKTTPADVPRDARGERKQPERPRSAPPVPVTVTEELASEKAEIAKVTANTPLTTKPVFERVADPPAPEKTASETKAAAREEARRKSSAKEAGRVLPPEAKDPGRTPVDFQKTHTARPTSSGDRSLIRALGLKIGRIVIDAGHGGHDTGTIGPSGYTEKELVLDVAKRLGGLIEDRLGSEVVYTRSDDTFVPLETRTAVANQKQADLFVSVHANSSRDERARGIETYYLNFTSSQDALEVAARENAVSEKSVHELQDLVKKITLKEKLEESREFAAEIQKSLYTTMSRGNGGLRNRGVKKAPFVVLIGANMPSILAEVSFVSNPTDERLLKKPEYRQKIAEALYRGILKYANSLSGVKVAESRRTSDN